MIVLNVPLRPITRALTLLRSPTRFYIRRTNWRPSGRDHGQVVLAAIPAADGLTVAALAGRWWGEPLAAASVTLFDVD